MENRRQKTAMQNGAAAQSGDDIAHYSKEKLIVGWFVSVTAVPIALIILYLYSAHWL